MLDGLILLEKIAYWLGGAAGLKESLRAHKNYEGAIL
jgi:hypothetical protein